MPDSITLRGFLDEDFIQYKKPAMFLGTATCDWKCCHDAGCVRTALLLIRLYIPFLMLICLTDTFTTPSLPQLSLVVWNRFSSLKNCAV